MVQNDTVVAVSKTEDIEPTDNWTFDPNSDDPATGVTHIATEDHRGRLTDTVGQWLKLAPELPRLQDRHKLKALCKEITAAVAASYQNKSSWEGRQIHASEASS